VVSQFRSGPAAPQPPPAPGQPDRTDPLTLATQDDIDFMKARHGATGGGRTHNWLPSLNLRFGLTDDQFIRFAASRAMARADMGLYKNYIGVARPVRLAAGGGVRRPGDCTSIPGRVQPAVHRDRR
jgi:hypothetical protein